MNTVPITVVLMVLIVGSTTQSIPKSVYPLATGNVIHLNELSMNDLETLAAYRMIYLQTFNTSTVSILRSLNPDLLLIEYHDSVPFCGPDTGIVEEFYIENIAMTLAANLTQAISASVTSISITKGTDLPILASMPGLAYSNGTLGAFIFFVRVEDEYMKVVQYNGTHGTLSVIRGFGGSQAANHAAGTPVLSPVYWSNPPDPTGVSNQKLCYICAPFYHYPWDLPLVSAYAGVVANLNSSNPRIIDGIWMDLLQTIASGAMTARGVNVENGGIWDYNTSAPLAEEDYVIYQQRRLARYQQIWPGRHWYGNSLEPAAYPYQKQLLLPNLAVGYTKPLDAYSFELASGAASFNCYGGFPGIAAVTPSFRTLHPFNAVISTLADLNANGLPYFFDIANAGCDVNFLFGIGGNLRQEIEDWAYAMYLLSVNSTTGNGWFNTWGFESVYVNGSFVSTKAVLYDRYLWPIGPPIEGIPAISNSTDPVVLYTRRFFGGLVLIAVAQNITTLGMSISSTLDEAYTDPETNATFSAGDQIVLTAPEGKILLAPSVVSTSSNPLPPVSSSSRMWPSMADRFCSSLSLILQLFVTL